MALPSISTPEFQTNIPSTGETITYRPFLVKEEKILLMAMEGKDNREIYNAVLKLLQNCITQDIDVNRLSTFDIEYLFLKLRGKSVGEVVALKVGHQNSECKHLTEVDINIDEIEVTGEISDGKVMITEEIGVKLRYPNMQDVIKVDADDAGALFDMISSCIEYIFDQQEVYNEFTKEEIVTWTEQLNQTQFKKITDFFENLPKLSKEVEWVCDKCGEKDSIKLEGMQSFFM